MKQVSIEYIEPFLEDDYIKSGLAMPVVIDYVKKRKHFVYEMDGGFALFVEVKPNIFVVSCAFYQDAKNIFKQCKAVLRDFTKDGFKVYSLVHFDNKKARMFNNALNLRFQSIIDVNKDFLKMRLYKYEGA